MRVILFGATGMVGKSALLVCIADPRVAEVVAVVRRPTGLSHPRLRELVHGDFADYGAVIDQLSGFDAAFFCLGVSAAGLDEAEYRRITYDFTLAAAQALVAKNPQMAFCYVSGQGTDSSEKGRLMWARVKGATENALLRLPFKGVYLFRPGYIQPTQGVESSTRLYRLAYQSLGFLYPLLRRVAPNAVTDGETHGRALIGAVAEAGPSRVIEIAEINRLGAPV